MIDKNIFFNESFLDKVFIENDKSKILAILKSAKKEDFSSEAHYTVYKMFVLPKLSMVGKEYEKTIKRRYRSSYRYKYKYKLLVGVSQSYVVLSFYYCRESYKVSGCINRIYYLLGKDSGKVFVNDVYIPLSTICNIDYIDNNDVAVCRVDDNYIKNVLGFEYELSNDIITIAEKGRYRVQGEIVMDVDNIDIDLKKYIIKMMWNEIEDYAILLLSDHLIQVIQDIGFDVDLRHGIDIADVVRRGKIEEDSYYVSLALFNELRKHFDDIYIKRGELTHIIEIGDKYYGNIRILVRAFEPQYGYNYGNIRIDPEIRPGECGQVCSEIKRELEDQIDMIQPINTNIAIGNHYINMKNVIPINIEYTPSLKPLNVAERVLRLRLNQFYVDEKSEVTITHKEHGTVKVRFSKPFMVMLTTTNINLEFAMKWNRAMLRIIKNMYKKQKH